MQYLLDTNICIYLMKGTSPALLRAVIARDRDDLAVSVVTVGELWFGVEKSARRKANARRLEILLSQVTVVAFDLEATRIYGRVRRELEARGTPIGPLDTLIAAHALALGRVLVTADEREFRRVKGLKVENWVEAGE